MAGYHMMIPYVMRELPKRQRDAMAQNVKAPLVYVKVAVRNWNPWVARRVHEISEPDGVLLAPEARLSGEPRRLPVLAHARRADGAAPRARADAATSPASTCAPRLRAARAQLFATPFDTFERNARDELTRMLGPGGFDADRDIAAITVNRWGHGYSYSASSLFDPEGERPQPFEVARARFGNVSFANADAAWSAYAHTAIAEGHRAARESLGGR